MGPCQMFLKLKLTIPISLMNCILLLTSQKPSLTPNSTGASDLCDRLPGGERGPPGGQHLRVAVAGDRAGMAMAFSREKCG